MRQGCDRCHEVMIVVKWRRLLNALSHTRRTDGRQFAALTPDPLDGAAFKNPNAGDSLRNQAPGCFPCPQRLLRHADDASGFGDENE
jgi:hypothetical protein